MTQMPIEEALRRQRVRFISGLWITIGFLFAMYLVVLWTSLGPAHITGRRVFGGVLVVSPSQPGDTHRIGEAQARASLDRIISSYEQSAGGRVQPKLVLFGFGRFATTSTTVTPVVKAPAWIGVFRERLSDLFFGCPQYPARPVPPKPTDISYFAVVIDPNSGTYTRWSDNSFGPYATWACATGNNQL